MPSPMLLVVLLMSRHLLEWCILHTLVQLGETVTVLYICYEVMAIFWNKFFRHLLAVIAVELQVSRHLLERCNLHASPNATTQLYSLVMWSQL